MLPSEDLLRVELTGKLSSTSEVELLATVDVKGLLNIGENCVACLSRGKLDPLVVDRR
jgi:hypothetical protein